MARQVLENGVILPAEYSDDWYDDMTSNLTKLDDVIGSDSEKLSSSDVGAAALSNNYNDLDNLPTIPTVNDATLTIQKNGVDVQTFTANASSNVTANITVPTKTSDLTNDSDFVVSSNLATVATSGDYDDLSNKPSIPTNTSDLNNDSNFVDTSNSAVASGITSAKVTDYDTHIADTDIHVTTADKATWNTVTSKAQDSDVVHKSGDETVAGNKTFSDSITFSSVSIADVRWKSLVNQTIDLNDCYITRVGTISGYYSASVSSGSNISNKASNTAFIMLSLTTRYISASDYQIYQIFYGSNNEKYTRTCSNGTWTAWINEIDKFVTTDTAQTISGNKTFSSINGVEPGSLSLPSGNASDFIDISSYFDNTSATNSYTASANGWIYLRLGDLSGCEATVLDANNNRMWGQTTTGRVEQLTIPILKGQTLLTQWATTSTVIVNIARFIPCQGNV